MQDKKRLLAPYGTVTFLPLSTKVGKGEFRSGSVPGEHSLLLPYGSLEKLSLSSKVGKVT